MRYFADISSMPHRYYALIPVDDGYAFLVNVEAPESPPYCLPLHNLFNWERFEEVGILLDDDYNPTSFRLKKGQARA